jgi:basic membrane protein A and related proteins
MKRMSYVSLLFLLCLMLVACVHLDSVTVSFDTNGGTPVPSIEFDGKSLFDLPDDPIKEGYLFDGWYLDSDLDMQFNPTAFRDNPIQEDFMLYAKWIEDADPLDELLKVTWDSMGGSAVDPTYVQLGSYLQLPETHREGYLFDGWYTSIDQGATLDEQWSFNDDTIDHEITLYAKWIEDLSREIAMITDSGDIDDKMFNQVTWEGIVEFAEENGKTYAYYKPTEVSFDAYFETIERAVENGAKVVVTPGFLFEQSVHKAQKMFPDVTFVLIDGMPHNVINWFTMETYDGEEADYTVAENTLSIFFKEHESGFLAGYAAVKEGFEELGFMGGMALPAVVRFGIGFIAGAYYAAAEEDMENYAYNPNYYLYLGDFTPSDQTKDTATSWYNAGVEAIHAAAGHAGRSVMVAAQENEDKWVFGFDVDQSSLSDTVISSAMKNFGVVVQQALEAYYDGSFEGGISLRLGIDKNAVGLPTGSSSWRFSEFSLASYDAIYSDIYNGNVLVPSDLDEFRAFLLELGVLENHIDSLEQAILPDIYR